MSDLLNTVERGQHRQFQYLRSWQEYSRARKIYRAEKLLVASIGQSADKLFKKYCKDIAAGETAIIKLIAYSTTIKMLKFYEEELKIITNMLVEYEYYLAATYWVDFLFGTQRPVTKLWDHRGI